MESNAAIILAASAAGCPAGSKRRVLPARNVVLAVLIAFHAISFHTVLPLAAQTPADVARAARDLPRSLDLQTELPLLEEQPEGWNLDVTRLFLWITVAVGAGVLAYCIYEVWPAFGMARRPRWDDPAYGDGGGAVQGGDAAARAAADELAAQGRFVEAMHVLLLQGLDEMRTQCDLRFADSLTSREIASRANAPVSAKVALRDIIHWVERAYFGDHPVGRNDYDACRRSFVALRGILRADGRE